MTKKDAEIFFDVVLKHPKLFWKANNTGCEAQADLVAELTFQKGFKVNKIWIRPLSPSDSFLVYLNEAGTEFTAWNYHVAAAVEVNDASNTETLIIDPTLFDKPVNLEFWHKRLSRLSNQYNVILEKNNLKEKHFLVLKIFLQVQIGKKHLLNEKKLSLTHQI
ncbi:protein-glutamine glutaminase family protein [Chondrinema litorale]|uniref:protein-glutamine glutaminase family protein n=1 Tax=Chondrinema litorale TaxID=2994555 RepID=UPI002543DBC4|nr:protein-glutamine glutaminase family protein [Chondrinema litorale]UZR96381.1 protein-glutamine glutaminase family protein [Chondrinema litorale]